MRNKLFAVIAAIVVIVVGLVLWKARHHDTAMDKLKLSQAIAKRGSITLKVTESGRVEPLTMVNIKSDFAGEIKSLLVDEGTVVEPGDTLAIIQLEATQSQQVATAWATLQRTKLELESAHRDLERKRTLFEKGFIAKKEVEDAEKLYEDCKINYELAKRQLKLLLGGADINPEELTADEVTLIAIKSPVSGVVINLNVEEGEMITSGTRTYGGGTVLMTIADLSKMIVKAKLNEIDVAKVKVGHPVRIGFDAIRGKVYHGKVRKISPTGTVEQNIVVYPVEVDILDADSLIKPGMTADIDIIVGEAHNVLLVPKTAIIERDGHKFVKVLHHGTPHLQPVVTGLEDDVNVEIKHGLSEGDTVLLQPMIGLPTSLGQYRRPSSRGIRR